MRFADTNILLYSISTVVGEQRKAETAISLLSSQEITVSFQVLKEFYVQAARTSRNHPLPHSTAVAFIEKWRRFQVQEITMEIMRARWIPRNAGEFPIGTRQFWRQPEPPDAAKSSPRTYPTGKTTEAFL